MAHLLAWERGIRLSGETIRRGLNRLGYVWRRPRPVVGPSDPEYAVKLRKIRRLLDTLPTDETAVFQDEVDLHLNPKIGSMWMRRGEQATVQTPRNTISARSAASCVGLGPRRLDCCLLSRAPSLPLTPFLRLQLIRLLQRRVAPGCREIAAMLSPRPAPLA